MISPVCGLVWVALIGVALIFWWTCLTRSIAQTERNNTVCVCVTPHLAVPVFDHLFALELSRGVRLVIPTVRNEATV